MGSEIEKIDEVIDYLKQFKNHLTCEATITPKLVTPAGIKFLMFKTTGNVAGLLFGEDKQWLGFDKDQGVFEVTSINTTTTSWQIREGLPMTPCKYEDLKPGDFFALREYPCQDSVGLCLPNQKYTMTDVMDVDCLTYQSKQNKTNNQKTNIQLIR